MTNAALSVNAPALRLATPDDLARTLQSGGLEAFQSCAGYASCLLPLLRALGWRGSPQAISEALPHFASALSLDEFRNVLAHLGYKTQKMRAAATDISGHVLPCLYVDGDSAPMAVLERQGNDFIVFDGRIGKRRSIAADMLHGDFYLVALEEHLSEQALVQRDDWIGHLLRRFTPSFAKLLGMTFLLNILPLMVPFFILVLYDIVIPARSSYTLMWLAYGLGVVFMFEFALYELRARLMSYVAGRMDYILSSSVFERLLSFPAGMTESAGLGAQISRLRQFESLRELFTGPLASVMMEIPFILIFMIVIAVLAGSLVAVPLVILGGFALLAALVLPRLRHSAALAAQAANDRHGFVVEMLTNFRSLREAGAEAVWLQRYRDLSAAAAHHHFSQSRLSFLTQTAGHSMMTVAGVATIVWGIYEVIDGNLTVGALIAAMALVWRALSPIQNLFMTLTRLHRVRNTAEQVNAMMRLPLQDEKPLNSGVMRSFRGGISLNRVGFRYRPADEPAIMGVTLNIAPGEMVAITGANSAGKSTLLSLILGLYRPQAGIITLDGVDIRQLHSQELRGAITYVPQQTSLFHGDIAQNLRLGNPTASDQDLRDACAEAGILDDILALKDGFHSRLGDQTINALNSGICARLALARAFLKKAPILLLDEAGQTLDHAGDARFVETLKKLKGKRTIIMVSHRPTHIRLADTVVLMDGGRITASGKPDIILRKLPGGKP